MEAGPRADRVSICATTHDFYRQLTEGNSAPFKTMKDLFLTAAAIGIQKGIKRPIEKKVGIFAWTQFSLQEDVPFIYALVLALGKPLETLLDHSKILDLLEEYANGGITEVATELLSATRPSLTLVNRILTEASLPEPEPTEKTP